MNNKRLIRLAIRGKTSRKNGAIDILKETTLTEKDIKFLKKRIKNPENILDAINLLNKIEIDLTDDFIALFLKVKKSVFDHQGKTIKHEIDFEIANYIFNSITNIDDLSKVLQNESFERFALCVNNWNPVNIKSIDLLIKSNTNKTINRVIYIIKYIAYNNLKDKENTNIVLNKINEFVKNSEKKINDLLLNELIKGEPLDQEIQTKIRIDLLHLLKLTSDKKCIPIILEVCKYDNSVREFGIQVIKEINPKYDIEKIDFKNPNLLQLKQIDTNDKFIDSCFNSELEEYYENRKERDMIDLVSFNRTLNSNDFQSAILMLDNIQNEFKDYFYLYYCYANIFIKTGDFSKAEQYLTMGIEKSKSKFDLYEAYAYLMFLQKDINSAIRFWIISVIIQIDIYRLVNYTPFLYLSVVSEYYSNNLATDKLLSIVDMIKYGNIRLNHEVVVNIQNLLSNQNTKRIAETIEILRIHYLESTTHNTRS